MYLLLILGLACIGVAVAATLRALSARRMRTTERLAAIDEYGFAAESTAPDLPLQRRGNGTTEFVAAVGAAVAQRFGSIREDDLRAELMAAGIYGMSPRTLLGYRAICAILLPTFTIIVAGFSLIGIAFALGMIAGGWMLPLIIVRRKARSRLQQIDRRLPDLIDLLVVTVEAGLGFGGALRLAAEHITGPLSDELRLTLQEQTMGLGTDEALSNMATRAATPGMLAFVRAMAQGERLGISIGHVLRNLAVDMRKRRRSMAEERAQKAPIKMLFPLVFLIFPAMFIVLMTPALLSIIKTLG
ncbi:MAG: type II secretion system F family protein [Solirubrobacteraceae bacterium]